MATLKEIKDILGGKPLENYTNKDTSNLGYDEEGNYDKTLEMAQVSRKESDMAKTIREQWEVFNLSHCIQPASKFDWIAVIDVKKFIKELKEKALILNDKNNYDEPFSAVKLIDIIDLAGDKLI